MALRTVMLGATGIETTALGFGCANLYRLPSVRGRSELLEAAYDAGVHHFDVAPMYGLGRAESEMGRFIRSRRNTVTVTTKFGIRPTALARVLARGQGPVRRTFEILPALREHAKTSSAGFRTGGVGSLLYATDVYDASEAKRSLVRSLRSLETDYVDLLLLHDPVPGSVRSEDVCCYLEDARQAGWIRSWGIAGEVDHAVEVAGSLCYPIPVLQLRDDVLTRPIPRSASAGTAFITFGALGGALSKLIDYVTEDRARRKRWSTLLGADISQVEVAASMLLRAALRSNDSGVVLFSTIRAPRILQAVAAAQTLNGTLDTVLDDFLDLVSRELRSPAYGEGDCS